ncbi:hypothetical protein V3C99_008258 [Haemonchus contortus]
MQDDVRARLAELVELELSLWDHRDESYKVREQKDRAWERIVCTLRGDGHSVTLADVKTLWRSLVDTWRKRRNRRETGSPAVPHWQYENNLKFLEGTEFTGRTISNIDEYGNFRKTLDEPGSAFSDENVPLLSMSSSMSDLMI